jgi:predicted Zn-dependent protease
MSWLDVLGFCRRLPPRLDPFPVEEFSRLESAVALLGEGKGDEALAIIEELVAACPTSQLLNGIAARMYYRVGRTAEGDQTMVRWIALDPENPITLKYAAHRARLGGQARLAEAILENGWTYMQRYVPKREWPAAREKYFALPLPEPAAGPAGS